MNCIFRCIITIAVLAAATLLVVRTPSSYNSLSKISLDQTSTTEYKSQILKRLRAINELHCAEAVISTIVTGMESRRTLGVEVGETKMIYVAYGTVRAANLPPPHYIYGLMTALH